MIRCLRRAIAEFCSSVAPRKGDRCISGFWSGEYGKGGCKMGLLPGVSLSTNIVIVLSTCSVWGCGL
jgi:hypothetical protein